GTARNTDHAAATGPAPDTRYPTRQPEPPPLPDQTTTRDQGPSARPELPQPHAPHDDAAPSAARLPVRAPPSIRSTPSVRRHGSDHRAGTLAVVRQVQRRQ